jgi:hypothetical protein
MWYVVNEKVGKLRLEISVPQVETHADRPSIAEYPKKENVSVVRTLQWVI